MFNTEACLHPHMSYMRDVSAALLPVDFRGISVSSHLRSDRGRRMREEVTGPMGN